MSVPCHHSYKPFVGLLVNTQARWMKSMRLTLAWNKVSAQAIKSHMWDTTYKVRLPNPSAGRGKRGGFRVVYYIKRADIVLMLTIYNKTQRSDIAPEQIRRIIEEYGNES
jgi:mRNA-degrading endonuclease RelE of RelBE toxin-antitoxin system